MRPATRSIALCLLTLTVVRCPAGAEGIPDTAKPSNTVNTITEPIASGKFQPTCESPQYYQIPG